MSVAAERLAGSVRVEVEAQVPWSKNRWGVIGSRPDDIADTATVRRARRGDRDAIATLWRTYQPQLVRLLRAQRTPSPEDVASQVWVDVGRALSCFEGDGIDFRRWLFTIARRRRIDALRRASRNDLVAAEDRFDDVADPTTDDQFEASDSMAQALALVGRLPPAAAEAVMLRVVFGLSVPDVADIMGRTDVAVRVLVHRGLARLRALVGSDAEVARGEKFGEDVTQEGLPALNTT